MCSLVRRAPSNLEKVAKNPVEKIASNPVTSVALMVFSALNFNHITVIPLNELRNQKPGGPKYDFINLELEPHNPRTTPTKAMMNIDNAILEMVKIWLFS